MLIIQPALTAFKVYLLPKCLSRIMLLCINDLQGSGSGEFRGPLIKNTDIEKGRKKSERERETVIEGEGKRKRILG